MNSKKWNSPLLCTFLLIVLSLTWSSVFAGEIKDRMLERLPVIKELKGSGVVGENNMGFLDFRKSSSSHQNLINQENADRKTVYSAIAQKQGATVDYVGKRRALQINEKADPGTWLQNENGQWYQK